MDFFRLFRSGIANPRAPALYRKLTKVNHTAPVESCVWRKIRYTEGTEKIMKKFACTKCSYLYRPAFGEEDLGIEPGTAFESIAESFECPACGAGEDAFYAVSEAVNEPFDLNDPSEAEAQHVPVFRETPEGVVVKIGTEDLPHPNEESHFFEWVALVDEDGEDVEIKMRPEGGADVLFEGYGREDFDEVRACCSIHGIWR